MAVDIRVLGPVRLVRDGLTVSLSNQARTVLAVLALRLGTPVSASQLFETLWSDDPPRSAKVHVQGLISALRRALGRGRCISAGCPIVTEPSGYVLAVDPSRLDLGRFRGAVAEAERFREEGDTHQSFRHYSAALDQWSGVPCEDIDRPVVRDLVEPLLEAYADVVEEWAALGMRIGQPGRVAARLRETIDRYPFRERMRFLLMAALGQVGRQAEALVVYEKGRATLANELGIDPSPALQRLYHDLLHGQARTAVMDSWQPYEGHTVR